MISAFIEIKGYLRKKVKEFSYFAFCLKKQGALQELFTLVFHG